MEAVVLVGHGSVAADTPRELLNELKQIQAARRRAGVIEIDAREAEIDRTLREWPRTPQSDPYKAGLEAIGQELRLRLEPHRRLVLAYNEFCAPSLEQAVSRVVGEGATKVVVVSAMITPGGSHAEVDVPAAIASLRLRHPGVVIEYAWPYRMTDVAAFLHAHIGRH
jgi:sirohydrochlorin cobaltochelatase